MKNFGAQFLIFLFLTYSGDGAYAHSQFGQGWGAWAIEHASPIYSLDSDQEISDLQLFEKFSRRAQILALGESDHGLHDIPEFRNRLIRYLVKEGGVRAVSLESGILEARLVEDYIQHGDVSLESAMREGITHGMGECQEVKELLVWMRQYNDAQRNHPEKKVHFFGFDLPVVGDAPIVPLTELAPYLKKVDSAYYNANFPKLLGLADKAYAVTKAARVALKSAKSDPGAEIDPDKLDAVGTIGFEQLTSLERTQLKSGISRLIHRLEIHRHDYERVSTAEEYWWNAQLAVIAGQHVRNLSSRQKYHKAYLYAKVVADLRAVHLDDSLSFDLSFDVDMTNRSEVIAQLKGRATRELMAAENVEWAQKRYGKVFIYAHIGHLVKSAVDVTITQPHRKDMKLGTEGSMSQGMYLASKYGSRYQVIAGSVGAMTDTEGNIAGTAKGASLQPVENCEACIENAFASLSSVYPAYFVSLKNLPGSVAEWFSKKKAIRWQAGFQLLDVPRGIDGLIYFDRVSPMESLIPLDNSSRTK